MTKEEKPNVIYKTNCSNRRKRYTGQSGRHFHLNLYEHKLAVELNDISLLISIHVNKFGDKLDGKSIEILDIGNTKNKEFLEARHLSQSAIDKHQY